MNRNATFEIRIDPHGYVLAQLDPMWGASLSGSNHDHRDVTTIFAASK
jgi:hypothetical protein